MRLDRLYRRYGQLIDKHFARGLSMTETWEKERITRILDRHEGKPLRTITATCKPSEKDMN